MTNAEQVLVSHPDAAWLPDGGRADVVLAVGPPAVPRPTCLVRLLATRQRQIFTTARADGGGLDIPTLPVGDRVVEDCLHALLVRVLGSMYPTTLLGYVRNVVQGTPDDYPWPSPDAYFVVWHFQLPTDFNAGGVWLDAVEAEEQLGDRHWWPLAAHVPR